MKKFLIILSVLYGGFCGMAIACESNEIDINGDGTECVNGKFAIKTTNLSNSDVFKFSLSASGTFTVNCGENGTLESEANDVSGNTITRNDTTNTIYTCTYSTGGVKTIGFDGLATGYSEQPYNATIRFDTTSIIAAIDGSLGQIFSTLGTSLSLQPSFFHTFNNGRNIKTIPGNLFSGVTGKRRQMFYGTFYSCVALTSIPAELFSDCYGSAVEMFESTFNNCLALKTIPQGLFKNISGGANYMFRSTFKSCRNLTSIPADLFGKITNYDSYMFLETFQYDSNLSGYIPPSLFAGLIQNGSPYTSSMMTDIFTGTKLATTCPAGTVQFVTGYEDYWGGKVSCVDENLACNAGEYLPAHWFKCEPCPQNNYCPGGTYPYSETISSGATQCPNNLYAPVGMSSSNQCGRILHIGDEIVYLHSTKKTTPALHVDIDQDGTADYFGNMTTLDVPMTRGTDKKLKLQYDGVTYSVYDDSIIP